MSALQLTRSQIITEGLSLAGRPDLLSSARLWLNLFLEKQYMNEDFDWLVKSVTGITVVDGVSFPDDYRAAKSSYVVASNGSLSDITIVANQADYDYKKLSYRNVNGSCPKYCFASHDLRQFFFLPLGSNLYTMNLKYFYIPNLPDYTDASTDYDVPKWGLPTEILVDHIKARAMEYNDDARQDNAMAGTDKAVGQAKFNNQDKRAGSSRFPMGKRFKNRFR